MIKYTEDKYDTLKELDGSVDKFTKHNWDRFHNFIKERMEQAEADGWKQVEVVFESTSDPYENYEGPVNVYILGMRPKTQEELDCEKEFRETERLANKLGITSYEAGILRRLQKQNKLGDLI